MTCRVKFVQGDCLVCHSYEILRAYLMRVTVSTLHTSFSEKIADSLQNSISSHNSTLPTPDKPLLLYSNTDRFEE